MYIALDSPISHGSKKIASHICCTTARAQFAEVCTTPQRSYKFTVLLPVFREDLERSNYVLQIPVPRLPYSRVYHSAGASASASSVRQRQPKSMLRHHLPGTFSKRFLVVVVLPLEFSRAVVVVVVPVDK